MAEQRQGQQGAAGASHSQGLSGASGGLGATGGSGKPGQTGTGGQPGAPDSLAGAPGADVWPEHELDDPADGMEATWRGRALSPEMLRHLKTRQDLREFLRAVPRVEAEATLTILRPDGTTRVLRRAELSAAIDRMRPRMRQVIRLSVEERWSRQRVCEYLRHISIKTFERDQVEGLDILAAL